MSEKKLGKFAQIALWFSPVVIVFAGFFAALMLFKPSAAVAMALTAAASIFVFGYSLYLGNRLTRRLDEVERAATSFAHTKGWVWGAYAALLLLMVPPVMDGLIYLVNLVTNAGAGSDMANQRAVRTAFFLSGVYFMVMQTLAIIVASFVWRRRMA